MSEKEKEGERSGGGGDEETRRRGWRDGEARVSINMKQEEGYLG